MLLRTGGVEMHEETARTTAVEARGRCAVDLERHYLAVADRSEGIPDTGGEWRRCVRQPCSTPVCNGAPDDNAPGATNVMFHCPLVARLNHTPGRSALVCVSECPSDTINGRGAAGHIGLRLDGYYWV